LFITLLNDTVCANDFAIEVFEYVNAFDAAGYGKICSRALAFNFVSMLLGGTITEY